MKNRIPKNGFTLIEVLVVVAILGILSSMGVVSFRQAIANSRVRDSAINVAAFLERASMTAREINDTLCVATANNLTKLSVYKGSDCSGSAVDSLILEGGVYFRSSSAVSSPISGATTNLVSNNGFFVPRIGLSSFRGSNLSEQTFEGFYLMQYSGSDTWGGVTKVPSDNRFRSHTYNGGWHNL